MVKRMWPAFCLVGALLLAAASLHAEETPALAVSHSRTGAPAPPALDPSTPPVACPALPGDDDMPNRSGGTSRVPSDSHGDATAFGPPVADGYKLPGALSLFGRFGLAYLVLFR